MESKGAKISATEGLLDLEDVNRAIPLKALMLSMEPDRCRRSRKVSSGGVDRLIAG
jgi:hypothetical protein